MGMYTALHLAIELKRDTPAEVLDILDYMTGAAPRWLGSSLPDHPLFVDTRWGHMLNCESAYFSAETHSVLARNKYQDGAHTLTVLSSFKNYSDEISKFVDWISPYIYEHAPKWIGYRWYEEDSEPTPLYRKEA